MQACPVKLESRRFGIKILQPLRVREKSFIMELEALKPEAIVVVAYGQILPSEIIHLPEHGGINLHASLLPKYRGAAPINWAIINGETVTGVTTMLMDEGIDTGPILLQKEVELERTDTARTLSEKLSKVGAELLVETLDGLENKSIKPVPQTGDTSYAPMLKKDDGRISWSKGAYKLYNLVRGLYPWPGAFSFLEGKRLRILWAEPLSGSGPAGVIVKATKCELIVGTGKGVLAIKEIQPEGKKQMPVADFLHGHNIREGMIFEK